MKKYSVASEVKSIEGFSFSAGQAAAIKNNGFTHYAIIETGSRCFSRVPRYFLDECKAAGFTSIDKIGGTTNQFVVIGLKK